MYFISSVFLNSNVKSVYVIFFLLLFVFFVFLFFFLHFIWLFFVVGFYLFLLLFFFDFALTKMISQNSKLDLKTVYIDMNYFQFSIRLKITIIFISLSLFKMWFLFR